MSEKESATHRSVALVFGTRPEIIKLSPIIRELIRRHIAFKLIHSNQHYSYELDQIFFEDLKLPRPNFCLEVGSGEQGEQTAHALARIEAVLIETRPSAVVVQGDTNTCLAGSLAAAKLHVPLFHVEAGLRSKDRRMPEEINRVASDHCSDFLFAPTQAAADNLFREGIEQSKIKVTGNTIVDAVQQNIELARKSTILGDLRLEEKSYVLATLHRAENVDDESILRSILLGLEQVQNKTGLPIILPIHPRTRKNMELFGIKPKDLILIDPVGYLDFLWLERNARLIMTDSGGIQEEACILQVPCVTLRDNTERPESVEAGANIVAGCKPREITKSALAMMERRSSWKNPFGDGHASERIVSHMESVIGIAKEEELRIRSI